MPHAKKTSTMTDAEQKKWNLRFCPKCNGHIQIELIKGQDGELINIKYCQNHGACNYKVVLKKENITDNDRHKIIESHFGYSKAFDTNQMDILKLTKDKLLFDSVIDFFKWYVPELAKYRSLDHNTLPVSSPYWTIIKKLGQFFSDNFEKELKQVTQEYLINFNEDEKRNLNVNSGFDMKIFWK